MNTNKLSLKIKINFINLHHQSLLTSNHKNCTHMTCTTKQFVKNGLASYVIIHLEQVSDKIMIDQII